MNEEVLEALALWGVRNPPPEGKVYMFQAVESDARRVRITMGRETKLVEIEGESTQSCAYDTRTADGHGTPIVVGARATVEVVDG